MGCNCKGGKGKPINNLKSVDHINQAREVYERIILTKSISEYDDFDRMDVFNTFVSLYPNSKYTPSIENAVENIKHAVLNYTR